MQNPISTIELIEKYLKGKLSEEEQLIFKNRMKEEKNFAEQIERQKNIEIAIDLMARLEKKKQVKKIAGQLRTKGRRIPIYRRAAAAVLLLAILGIAYLFIGANYSNEQLTETYFLLYDRELTTKSSSYQNTLTSALNAYNSGNFFRALEEFSALPDTINEYWLAQTFVGNCQLELGKTDDAVNTFSRIEQESDLYEETARWYLALAYLSRGDESNARRLFNKIEKGQYNYTNAQELLRKLNSPIRMLPGI